MPPLPCLWERRSFLGFKILESVILSLSHELEKEWFVRGCRALLIMQNVVIPNVIINEMFERNSWIIVLMKVPLVVIGLSHILKCCLHAFSNNILVLRVALYLLGHIAAIHKASINSFHLLVLSGDVIHG